VQKLGEEKMKSRLFFCDYWEDLEANLASTEARYLGAYLWTNSRANLIGLFPMTSSFVYVETAIETEKIGKAIIELEALKKAHFYKNWIYLPNAQEICGYISEKNHGVAASKELSRVPPDVLNHFRSLGYTIPYPYPTDSPLNPKTKTINHEQGNKNNDLDSDIPVMMTSQETDEIVDWSNENMI
jgi:hypothetical protein